LIQGEGSPQVSVENLVFPGVIAPETEPESGEGPFGERIAGPKVGQIHGTCTFGSIVLEVRCTLDQLAVVVAIAKYKVQSHNWIGRDTDFKTLALQFPILLISVIVGIGVHPKDR